MTITEWLAARTPAPPAALAQRIARAVGDEGSRSVADAHEVLVTAGERIAGEVLSGGGTSRDAALDLLAADALVTYAFEALSQRPRELARGAERSMARIAILGTAS